MEPLQLLLFAAAYLAVLVLPGPGVLALVARVLGHGTRGAPIYIAGFVAGALVWFTVAALGLAALAAAFSPLFVAIRYAGAAYLLYLAWKLWRAPVQPVQASRASAGEGVRLFLAGLAVNLGNPKAIVFFLALLPTVVDVRALTALGFAELAMIVAAVVAGVLGAYALAASRARRLFGTPRRMRLLNRGSSAVMAGAAVSITLR